MKSNIVKSLGMGLLLVGVAGLCFGTATYAPEIDGATAGNAVALLTGAILVVRGRKS